MTTDPLFDDPPERRGSGSLKWDIFRGNNVLPFWVADMDFASPPEIAAAIRARADHGVFGYGLPRKSEIQAVVHYLRNRHGVSIKESWLVWLPGLVPALSVSCAVARERGARAALSLTPAYPPFLRAPADAGLAGIEVPLSVDAEHRAYLDVDQIAAQLTSETGLLFLCNPQNPTGRVFERQELEPLIDLCNARDLILCSDEVHCDLIFDDERTPHRCLLQFEGEIRNRLIVLMSASKTYNIAGLGCAFAIIPDPKLRQAFRRAKGCWVPPVNVFGYVATEAAFRHGEPWRRRLIAYLKDNREIVRELFRSELPEIPVTPSEATYLAWLDLRALDLESPKRWFESHGVGLSDGADFGMPGFVRLNFGCSRALLGEGLQRIKRAVHGLKSAAPN